MAILCLACRAETEMREGLHCCPNCGDKGVPADTNDCVSVTLTWHELRILVMWAERWAAQTPEKERLSLQKVVYGIADALQLQHPEKVSLTFMGEVSELRGAFGDKNIEVHGFNEPKEPRP